METLTLNRKFFSDISTIGDLYLQGDFFSHTIELSCRRGDEKGLLAIPAGRYRVDILPSAKYGKLMPRLLNVPGREGILIHPANRAQELDGCIAPGVYNSASPDWVSSSRKTFENLFEKLSQIVGEKFITITGGYPFINTPAGHESILMPPVQ